MHAFKRIFAIVLILGALVLGLLIYLEVPQEQWIHHWVSAFGISGLREIFPAHSWYSLSMPDALWMFALSLSIILIWDFRWCRQSILWLITAICVGLLFEIAQAEHWVPGTFDPVDVFSVVIGGLAPLMFMIRTQRLALRPGILSK